jgi:hypothetical protein
LRRRGIEGLNGKYPVHGKTKEAGGYGKSLKEDFAFLLQVWAAGAIRKHALPTLRDRTIVDKYGMLLRFNTKILTTRSTGQKCGTSKNLTAMGAVILWRRWP